MHPKIEDMRALSKQVNDCKDKCDWDGAIQILLADLVKYPNKYWTYTVLAELHLIKDEFPIALEYATKAYEMEKRDPLVIYNYADALIYNDWQKEGIKLLRKILNMDLNRVAYGIGGEGMRYAKGLTNDCRAMIGIAYMKLGNKSKALEYFKSHLGHRQRGIGSAYTKRWIDKKIEQIDL